MALFVKNQYASVISLSETDFHITKAEL